MIEWAKTYGQPGEAMEWMVERFALAPCGHPYVTERTIRLRKDIKVGDPIRLTIEHVMHEIQVSE